MPTGRRRRFSPDADLDGIVSELDDRRARAVAAGNYAAIYDRLYDALPAAEREATLAPMRELIRNHADGNGRGARRWITRHQQDLIDYNRYLFVRLYRRIGVRDAAGRAADELGHCDRAVMGSHARVRRALLTGDDGHYYFSSHLVIASDDHPAGQRALPDPDLLNALPRL